MTTTIGALGRLCNGLIRNMGVSLLAERFGLQVTYQYAEEMNKLGLKLFSGSKVHQSMVRVTDANYGEFLAKKVLFSNLHVISEYCYLQTAEVAALIYTFLRRPVVASSIIAANPYKQFYNNNESTFVHVRLTDVRHFSPGSKYFLKAIAATKFKTLYIASDDFEDEIVKEIIAVYPDAVLFSASPIHTIQFGSTCRNVILSGGSFSAMIGLLGFFSTVQYPENVHIGYDPERGHLWQWCGDMFSGHGWAKVLYK